MNKNIQYLLLSLALLLPATATAYDFEVDGIYYNIFGNMATVTISPSSNKYSGSVTIPATVTYNGKTYSVKTIGNSAFSGCSGLTSIDIPYSVTTIGNSAFYGCSGLTSIDIPNSVTSFGDYAFNNCSGLTSIDIPNSVTSIGNYAFNYCSGLTSIIVASGNTHYDSRDGCNAIIETASNTLIAGCKNTTIPSSVATIGNYAFHYCSGLTSIDIPNSVTTIGNYAFNYCSGLTSIDIPNSVATIGNGAFSRCSGLTTVTIGNSVTSIGNYAFYLCSELTEIYSFALTPPTVEEYTFSDCYGATLYVLSEALNAYKAANYWKNFTDIVGQSFIFEVDGIYYHATTMSTASVIANEDVLYRGGVVIPDSVTYEGMTFAVTGIEDNAFDGCFELTSVTIPNSVATIGNFAFSGCSGLTEIYSFVLMPPTIYENTFSDCYGATLYVLREAVNAYKVANYWKNFTVIVDNTFEVDGIYYCVTTMNTAGVIANEDEETLYSGDVVIPDSVTYQGVTFAVTGIEDNAFDNCYELTSVVIPCTVETIGEQAFQGCTSLTSVIIGSGVTAIGTKAFNYCNALSTVKCLGTVPPVMASTDCFSTAAYNRATLRVPRNSEAAYAAADYWYRFSHFEGWGSAGMGDLDGDGLVNIKDVTALIDALLSGNTEDIYFESADMNYNGHLDISDVTTLIDYLLNN